MSIRRTGLTGGTKIPRTICSSSSLDQVQLADDPSGLWPLQGNANDISGNGRNGTLTGGAWSGTAIGTNGTDSYTAGSSYITVPGGAWNKNDSYTFEILVQATSFPSYCCPGGWNNPGGYGLLWAVNDTAYIYNNSGGTYNLGSLSLSAGTPYLLAAKWDQANGTISFLKNGTVVQSVGNGNTGADKRVTQDLYMGTSYPPYYYWTGKLSYAAYYGTALSNARLLAHAQAAGLA